jgi:chitinase
MTEAGPVETDEHELQESVVPWPTEESASAPPSLFTPPEPPPARQPEPIRAAAPPPAYPPPPPRQAPAAAADRYSGVPFAATPGSQEVVSERRKVSPVLIVAIVVALIALAGIVWMLRTSMSGAAKQAANVEITIYPTAAKVVAGKGVDFAATITGAPTSDVTWKVEEGDNAGEIKTRGAYPKDATISLYCTYTAPKTPGTYHLVATSTADTSKSATAEISVTAK